MDGPATLAHETEAVPPLPGVPAGSAGDAAQDRWQELARLLAEAYRPGANPVLGW